MEKILHDLIPQQLDGYKCSGQALVPFTEDSSSSISPQFLNNAVDPSLLPKASTLTDGECALSKKSTFVVLS